MPQIVYVIGAVLGFGFIVFIHELGHFLAAKFSGIKVKAFSLGFPPTVLHRQIGETDYRLGLIPIGGYVVPLGEDPDDPEAKDDPRAIHNAPKWKQVAILSAGVFMNVLSAMVIYLVASTVGVDVTSPVVGGTSDPSPARAAGLQPGDRIESIDGDAVESFEAIRLMATYGGINDPRHRFEVRIAGRDDPVMMASTREGGKGLPQLGIFPPWLTRMGELDKGCAAEKAGLRRGDRIVAVNGTPVRFAGHCSELIRPLLDRPFTLTVERPTATVEIGARRTGPQIERIEIAVDPAAIREPHYGLTPLPWISRVVNGSAAEAAGLKSGDTIVEIAGRRHPRSQDISQAIQASGGKPIPIRVWRDGETVDLEATPQMDETLGYLLLGIVYGVSPDEAILVQAGRTGPATDAGIPDGSRIVEVNRKHTGDWAEVFAQLDKAGGEPVEVAFRAPGADQMQTVTVTPRMAPPQTFFAGVTLDENLTEELKLSNPLKAIGYGLTKIKRVVALQYVTLKGMTTRQVETKELMGPLRIGVAFYQTASAGWGHFFSLLGMVSVAIALLNIMPVPPLDGGQITLLLVEAAARRPIPRKVRAAIIGTGLVLILCVVGLALFNDGIWAFRELVR